MGQHGLQGCAPPPLVPNGGYGTSSSSTALQPVPTVCINRRTAVGSNGRRQKTASREAGTDRCCTHSESTRTAETAARPSSHSLTLPRFVFHSAISAASCSFAFGESFDGSLSASSRLYAQYQGEKLIAQTFSCDCEIEQCHFHRCLR